MEVVPDVTSSTSAILLQIRNTGCIVYASLRLHNVRILRLRCVHQCLPHICVCHDVMDSNT